MQSPDAIEAAITSLAEGLVRQHGEVPGHTFMFLAQVGLLLELSLQCAEAAHEEPVERVSRVWKESIQNLAHLIDGFATLVIASQRHMTMEEVKVEEARTNALQEIVRRTIDQICEINGITEYAVTPFKATAMMQ